MKNLLFLIVAFTVFSTKAQEKFIFTELGGPGAMVSLNYEGVLYQEGNLYYRVGVGYLAGWAQVITFPIGINYLLPIDGNDFFELGANYTFGYETYENYFSGGLFVPSAGFKLFNKSNSTYFRISFSPLIDVQDSFRILPWGGLSFGVRL